MTIREIATAIAALLIGAGGTYSLGAVQTPIEKVVAAQAASKSEYGKYFQVIEYLAPTGDGYQIIYHDAQGEHSVGYGVEAASRTYFKPAPVRSATSTQ